MGRHCIWVWWRFRRRSCFSSLRPRPLRGDVAKRSIVGVLVASSAVPLRGERASSLLTPPASCATAPIGRRPPACRLSLATPALRSTPRVTSASLRAGCSLTINGLGLDRWQRPAPLMQDVSLLEQPAFGRLSNQRILPCGVCARSFRAPSARGSASVAFLASCSLERIVPQQREVVLKRAAEGF